MFQPSYGEVDGVLSIRGEVGQVGHLFLKGCQEGLHLAAAVLALGLQVVQTVCDPF